jgi:hypothetical protein
MAKIPTRAMPAWHNMPINSSIKKYILVWFISTVSSLSCQDFPTKWYDLDLWPLTQVIKCTKLHNSAAYDLVSFISWLQNFNTEWCYDIDLEPWQTIDFFLSSRQYVPILSCMILKLTVQSLSCLQGFNITWYYQHDVWPWKTTGCFFLSW